MTRRGGLRLLPLLVLIGAPLEIASAQESQHSAYEQETIGAALDRYSGRVDPDPEGKIVEAIEIEVLDVIEERDPVPGFLNVFHCNTRRRIVRRELLFREGQPYERSLIQETERNLRGLRQHSLAIIMPLVGSQPDRVRVLVIVKDVWSLRLNSGYVFQNGKLEYLLLQPAEENLFGRLQRVSTQFIYEPDTVSVGARFIEPRLADSRVLVSADANVIVNHESGDVEGSFGALQYGVPLYSTRQKWAWGMTASWRRETTRIFKNAEIKLFPDPEEEPVAPGVRPIPMVYDTDIIDGRLSGTRSFGTIYKSDITLGAQAARRNFDVPDLSGYDPALVARFRAERVPLSETRNGPFIQYHFYVNRYTRLLDVETYGLQESFRLGPELYLRFYPVAEAFGSTRTFFGYQASASYTFAPPDALVRFYAATGVEAMPDASEVFNATIQGGLRIVSPRFVVGRLIYDGTFIYRPENLTNVLASLGGDGRLRGYLSGAFIGENLVASNLEFRSRALQLWTVQLAGAAFYDVGDAFDDTNLRPKQGAGFGARLLFPQLGRTVMRIDWGFALPETPIERLADGLVVTFEQAFEMPAVAADGGAR